MMTPITRQDILAHQAVDIHEMLGTKVRARFQRKRGRDLFDLYWALTKAANPVDPSGIVESFQHYMKQDGTKAGCGSLLEFLKRTSKTARWQNSKN
jgi:predicted nucleotidyltransferase component of viral defense system